MDTTIRDYGFKDFIPFRLYRKATISQLAKYWKLYLGY